MAFSYEEMINNLIKRVAKKAYIAGIKKGFRIGNYDRIKDFEINSEAIEEAWQKYKEENI